MTFDEADAVAHRLFVDCNRGAYAYQWRSSREDITQAFISLGEPMMQEIDRLTQPHRDAIFRNVIAEIIVVFIIGMVESSSSTHERDRIVLSAEIVAAEAIYDVMKVFKETDFTPGNLWIALLHYEADHDEHFKVDYFAADPPVKNRYIAHACLDLCLPGSRIPDSTVDYASRHMNLLTEICVVARERRTLKVEQIMEVIRSHPRSISSGVL